MEATYKLALNNQPILLLRQDPYEIARFAYQYLTEIGETEYGKNTCAIKCFDDKNDGLLSPTSIPSISYTLRTNNQAVVLLQNYEKGVIYCLIISLVPPDKPIIPHIETHNITLENSNRHEEEIMDNDIIDIIRAAERQIFMTKLSFYLKLQNKTEQDVDQNCGFAYGTCASLLNKILFIEPTEAMLDSICNFLCLNRSDLVVDLLTPYLEKYSKK